MEEPQRPVAPPLGPQPELSTPAPKGSGLATMVGVVIAVGVLYIGRDILVPLALAILLSFILAPLLTRLMRLGLSRIPAVALVVALAFSVIGSLGLLVGSQLVQLAGDLPTYQHNIEAKIRMLQESAPGGGVIDRAALMFQDLQREVEEATGPDEAPEIPEVRMQQPPPSALDVLHNVAGPILGPIGTAGIVVVFVVFMLLEREDLRDRLIRLGGGDLYLTTAALDEAAHRVSRYLLMQLTINVSYGVPIGVGLYLIGVPNALLWGVLATMLRFIPYAGPFIAALFPIALSLAVDPGWSTLFWTIGLILILELVSNNVLEPWLYGSSTGISAVAIILAAIFWTTLWGPVGLLLSTPLTVCLAVLGRYVPQLRFLDVLLGSAPALSPAEHFYQRMLAGDPDEGMEIAEEYLDDHTLEGFIEDVAFPALRLAEHDRRRQALDADRTAIVARSINQVVSDLADDLERIMAREDRDATGATNGVQRLIGTEAHGTVLCLGGRTELDTAAAALLSLLLERCGFQVRLQPAEMLTRKGLAELALDDVAIVCLSYLGATGVARARQAVRRLCRRKQGLRVVACFWNHQIEPGAADHQVPVAEVDAIAVTLEQAVKRLVAFGASQ